MKPKAIAQSTQALLNDEGITYNQAGVTYNDIRYTYGGVYGQQDDFPSRVVAENKKPNNLIFTDKPQLNTAEV